MNQLSHLTGTLRPVALLSLLLATAAVSAAPAAGPSSDAPPPGQRVNTATPFQKGDILVAATVMNDPEDDHAGVGRLLQYDADLNYKGELWLEGSTHKVGGLAVGPDKTVWAMAQLTPVVMEIGPDAVQKPVRKFSDHKYSSVTFGKDGSLYFCDHMQGKVTGHPAVTTRFKLLPGKDIIGNGHIFRHAPDGTLIKEYNNPVTGNPISFLACTSTVLTDDDTRMIYVSENGSLVMQYDLANDRPLPHLKDFSGDPVVRMVLVMNAAPDGRLLISYGGGFLVMDPRSGEVLRTYPLPGPPGWAVVNASIDGRHGLTANFWTGEVIKVDLSDGSVTARAETGQKKSVSGIVQFP
jgi:hypothetical protein